MSIFPQFDDDELDEEQLDSVVETTEETYREYALDYKNGRLLGTIVEGSEAIAVWATLALQTERYEHTIYSWDFGSELRTLIGQTYEPDLHDSEVTRMIEECLLVNEHIKKIRNVSVDFNDDKIVVRFTMETDAGDEEVETYV